MAIQLSHLETQLPPPSTATSSTTKPARPAVPPLPHALEARLQEARLEARLQEEERGDRPPEPPIPEQMQESHGTATPPHGPAAATPPRSHLMTQTQLCVTPENEDSFPLTQIDHPAAQAALSDHEDQSPMQVDQHPHETLAHAMSQSIFSQPLSIAELDEAGPRSEAWNEGYDNIPAAQTFLSDEDGDALLPTQIDPDGLAAQTFPDDEEGPPPPSPTATSGRTSDLFSPSQDLAAAGLSDATAQNVTFQSPDLAAAGLLDDVVLDTSLLPIEDTVADEPAPT